MGLLMKQEQRKQHRKTVKQVMAQRHFNQMAGETKIGMFVLTHEHRHGMDVKLFKSTRTLEELLNDVDLYESPGINYEPQPGENVTINTISIVDIPEV